MRLISGDPGLGLARFATSGSATSWFSAERLDGLATGIRRSGSGACMQMW